MSDDQNGGLNGKSHARAPVRVLEIIGNAITGGMETYARNLVAGLPRDEFEVTCLLPFESPYTASLRELGCRTYIAPLHDDPLWRSIEMAVEIVRQHRIDVIHANLPNAHTLAGLVGRVTGVPAVTTIHSRGLWIQELSVARLMGVHLITVCQEAQAAAFAAGLPPESVHLIRNGVDTTRFTPARSGAPFRASIGVAPDATLVGFVGRLSWEKGPDKFIHVAERILDHVPDAVFAMVGEGPVEPDLRALLAAKGLTDRVRLAGLRRDVETVYPAFDLMVQTSRSEAMPLALLEAMASGVPVVAIGVGGVSELVEVGTTGLLVSPGDAPGVPSPYPGDWPGIAAASLELLRAPDRLAGMRLAARRRAEQHFDLRTTVAETASLFTRLARPAHRKGETWQPTVVRDKGEASDRRVRLKPQAALDAVARSGLAAIRSADGV